MIKVMLLGCGRAYSTADQGDESYMVKRPSSKLLIGDMSLGVAVHILSIHQGDAKLYVKIIATNVCIVEYTNYCQELFPRIVPLHTTVLNRLCKNLMDLTGFRQCFTKNL